MMKQKVSRTRKLSLYMVFIRYLLRFCVLTVILVAGTLIVYSTLVNSGIIRLPTYEQSQIEEATDKIKAGGNEAALLPDSCTFGVYDPEGSFLYGTFEGKEQQDGWNRWKSGDTGAFYNIFYRSIKKNDGNLVIVRYEMVAKFTNPSLRAVFPNAELLILFAALLLFLAQTALTARSFGRYLKRRLDTLTEIAAKVGGEDLEFEREYSDIREVDDVLGALFKMKEALQRSLKEQWKSRVQKQEQIAALAHDIKTPLTIIRGNAELMQETENMEEIREWDQEVLANVVKLERYLAVLQEAVRASEQKTGQDEVNLTPSGNREQKERFPAGPFLEEVQKMADALGRRKNLIVDCAFPSEEFIIQGRQGFRDELIRAVGNVLTNGVDYCPDGGRLEIRAERIKTGELLQITVTDSGPGFSEEALRRGTEQFYQADRSRTDKRHYGMGLYIARSVLEENGGALELKNSRKGGGEVRIYVSGLTSFLDMDKTVED